LEIIGPELELVGKYRRIMIPPQTISLPSLIRVSGSDVYFNTVVALAWLGFPREFIEETGFNVLFHKASSLSIDPKSCHYIGPYFRWEVSGFWSTLADEISMGGSLNIDSRADKIMNLLRMEDLKFRNPATLSGGETAKLVLAAHLVRCPRFLVLDRVLGELDERTRLNVLTNLKEWIPNGIIMVVDNAIEDGFDLTVSTDSDIAIWTKYSQSRLKNNSLVDVNEQLTIESIKINNVTPIAEIHTEKFGVFQCSRRVFNPVDWSAISGNFVTISGPNGCGKTSFLEGLAGLLQTEGRVILKKNQKEAVAKDFFALSPQDPQCDITEKSIQEELTIACNDRNLVASLLDELGLSKIYHNFLLYEDIGLQKLTSVIAATIRNRPCCLLDEPTLYLNVEFRKVVKRAIKRYLERGGIIFCSSHDRDFISSISKDV